MKKLLVLILLGVLLAGTVSLGLAAYPSEAILCCARDGVASPPPDAVLITDVVIDSDIVGHRRIQRWEHVIDDVIQVHNDYVRVHVDVNTNEIILYEKHWRDIDIDLAALEIKPFEPPDGEYVWKKVVLFVDEGDCGSLGDFFEGSALEGLPLYSLSGAVEYPLVCWEVRYADGSTVVYDLDGNRIGHGMIAAPLSEGYLASGTDPNPFYEGAWILARNNANYWYSRWTDSTTSVYNPDPNTDSISPYVSDPDTLFHYAIGHGNHKSYSGLKKNCVGEPYYVTYYTTRPDQYPGAPDAYDDMQNRGRMHFALMVHCDSMTQTGHGSFSHAFRKGSYSGTVTVGFTGLGEASLWENLGVFYWQDTMLEYMDEGYKIKEAFDRANIEWDLVAPYARFAGDTMQKVVPGVMGYVAVSIPPYGAFPLQGARVEVEETGDYAFTDYYGYYEIVLPPGTYTLTASYPTLEDRTYPVEVYPNRLTSRDFILEQEYPGMPIPLGVPGDGLPEGEALPP
jgi:hypothetical protein